MKFLSIRFFHAIFIVVFLSSFGGCQARIKDNFGDTSKINVSYDSKDLRYFGAIPDDSKDDRIAIEKALSSGIDTLHIPKGNFQVNERIVAGLARNLYIKSDGTIFYDGPNSDVLLDFFAIHFFSFNANYLSTFPF